MRLAFHNQGRYAEFDKGYDLYVKRSKTGEFMDKVSYKRVIRSYCRKIAEILCRNGAVELASGFGSISAAVITRRPQYRGKRFIGYGGYDWKNGMYDGKLKTFGIVYLPRRDKNANLRCLGFVANRRLFKKMKNDFIGYDCPWYPIEYNNEMI